MTSVLSPGKWDISSNSKAGLKELHLEGTSEASSTQSVSKFFLEEGSERYMSASVTDRGWGKEGKGFLVTLICAKDI